MTPTPDIPERPAAWPPPRSAEPVAAALGYARWRDPFGDVAHTALALLSMFLIPLGTTPKVFAWIALAVCAVVRLPYTWRSYTALLRDPLVWVLVAWSAWRALSLLWSPDPVQGFREFGTSYVLLLPLVLWPVLDRAPWMVGAFLAGVLVQNAIQLGQYLHWFGLHPGANQRLRALQHPIQTGALCAAAACWHLAAILRTPRGRGPAEPAWSAAAVRLLAFSLAGLGAALAGLIGSGSRGPWLAAAFSLPLQVVVIGARRPEARRAAVLVAVLAAVAAVATWPVTSHVVRLRMGQAADDMRALGTDSGQGTDVGQRIARWDAAWNVFRARPLAGTGLGGYADAAAALGYEMRHGSHAHSFYLHELATTGLGAALVLPAVALCVRRLWRGPPGCLYADGTLFVLGGWLVGALFDCYELNGAMLGLFAVAVAFSLRHAGARPGPDLSGKW